MKQSETVFDFIRSEEAGYQSTPISVIENYEWNMAEHIKTTVLYKNSQYLTGKTDDKPFKNIIRPILNLQYRAEGFDVKDIQLFVNESKNYYKSFLVKKYHEKWARENEIDTFIDEMVESYVDYGGALIKNINGVRPEVVPLPRLAFCDQTDILSGPICEKHFYSPSELQEMKKKGWQNIDDLIVLSETNKEQTNSNGKQSKTPSKYIEIYELHGTLPEWWLDENVSEDNYVPQLQIIAFYKNERGENGGITLFKGKEKESIYKLVLRDKIHGRALGLGGAEELFEPQVWVNYDIIRMKGMLDQASKIIYQTTDDAFKNRNKTDRLENGEVLILKDGKTFNQVNTTPVNITVFENSVMKWEEHARQMGAATESIMGEQPSSGTPFKLQELITAEAHSLHEYRKGKLATFLDEVYRDWIIPRFGKKLLEGDEFLADLDMDEMQSVADSLVICESNKMIKDAILKGEVITQDVIQNYRQTVRDMFMKGGSKKFIEILKGEMKDLPIDIKVNIAGKQKNLAGITDKLVNVFRTIVANPQVLQDPAMAKIFNMIIESSGLDPLNFDGFTRPQPQQMQAPQMQPQEIMPQPAQVGASQTY